MTKKTFQDASILNNLISNKPNLKKALEAIFWTKNIKKSGCAKKSNPYFFLLYDQESKQYKYEQHYDHY